MHHPGDRHGVLIGRTRQRVHLHDVAILERKARRDAARHWYIDCRPRGGLRAPRLGRQHSLDLHALQCRVGPEPSRRLNHVGECLALLCFIDRGSEHGAAHPHAGEMHRHEHDVTRLEPDIVARVAPQQIVVQIERRDRLAEALHLHAAQLRPLGHPARRVQRREDRAE